MATPRTKKTTPKAKKAQTAPKAKTVTVECDKLRDACLLFAFHDYSKFQYQTRMALSGEGATIQQRVTGLKNYYSSRLNTIKEIYDAVLTSKSKTKQIQPEIEIVLTPFYHENTDSRVPDNFTWPTI